MTAPAACQWPGRALRFLHRLSWRDRIEVVHAGCLLAVIGVGLRTASLPVLLRVLRVNGDFAESERGLPMTSPLPSWAERRIELVRLVTARSPGPSTCLRTALLTASRLRQLDPALRIGVTRDHSGLQAHAWVEIGGRYFDPAAGRFDPVHQPG